MKKLIFFLALILIYASTADACVGKILYIGINENSPEEKLLAEMLSVLINERTGTTVNIRYYRNSKELYNAVKRKEVGILIENTNRAMEILGRPRESNAKRAYEISKEEFRKNMDIVWLEPFGLLNYSPLIAAEVLINFPALPRVINKLSGIMNEEIYTRLVRAINSGEKPRKVARDFLKSKKLI